MRLFAGAIVCSIALLALVGCSDSDRPQRLSGNTTTSSGGTTSGSGGAGAAGSGGDAQGGSTSSGGGGAGGGPVLMAVSIVSDNLVIDCSASAPADALMGNFSALYDNTLGTILGSVMVLSAEVLLDGGNNTLTWSFDVTPNTVNNVPIGEVANQTHTKVAASGSGTGIGELCDYCLKGQTLTVTWLVDSYMRTYKSDPQGSYCQY